MTDSTAATAQATRPEPGRCSNCNAKLPDTPVSLCPYCAMPLLEEQVSAPSGGESPNAGRIARIAQHEDYSEAMQWVPTEGKEYQAGGQRMFHGRTALAVGLALLLIGEFLANRSAPVLVLGSAAIAAGVWMITTGAAARRRAIALPLLRRAALILDRRSETELRGWSGATTYFFTIELEGGVVAEFRYPGRGSHEELYVNNLPGIAYTRGQDLLSFRHIHV